MFEKSNSFAREGLHALLSQNDEAQKYFDSLPDYIREMIETRADSVHKLNVKSL